MEQNGFSVVVNDVDDLTELKARYLIPNELQSCHTAIVDGYAIEGHVPVSEINRLLSERPDIVGLAVAGMPGSAPGMETAGGSSEPFDVVAFDREGRKEVWAHYP